ncbi:carboxypeptidase B-like [Schistocerca serialis cubense]|uniref:carboxypeptidase B-like n=2 Tax=Schistocerca TaxID=7008 RepID=UPI00214E594A|nr:carboxypeptidase B-like [Schistocerca serialis cubense]
MTSRCWAAAEVSGAADGVSAATWAGLAQEAAAGAEAEAALPRVSYSGAQLLRVTAPADAADNVRVVLRDNEDVMVWSDAQANGTVSLDVLVKRPGAAEATRRRLLEAGAAVEVAVDDLQRAIDEENPPMSDEDLDDLMGRNGHRMEWQSYHRLADIHQFLDFLAATYPQRFSVQTIGSSVQGRPLKVVRVSSGKPGAPAIWVDGGIHAREWISPASVTYFLNTLVDQPEALGAAGSSVDWFVLPVVNPDGYEFSHSSDRLWRKNRGGSGSGRCAGIDLNRNFGYRWGGQGASRRPCDETYAGPSKFSEPETSAIRNFVSANRNIKAYVSFHSYGQYVLYPWGYAAVVPPDHEELKRVGQRIASAIARGGGGSYTVGPAGATLYPASGGSDDWAKGSQGIKYAYTVELRDRGRHGFVLPAQYIVPTGRDAVAALAVVAEAVTKL